MFQEKLFSKSDSNTITLIGGPAGFRRTAIGYLKELGYNESSFLLFY
jgi:hypothetical protein